MYFVCVFPGIQPVKDSSILYGRSFLDFLQPVYISSVHRKPAKCSVSTPQTTTIRKVLLPTPKMPPLKGPFLPSGAKKATAGKLVNQKTAAKAPTTVTKAKVLVSKAKNVSTKQLAKMGTGKTGKLSAKFQLPGEGVETKKVRKGL